MGKKYSNFEQDAASWLNNYGIGAFNGTGTKVFFANNAGLGVLNSQTGELIKKVSTLPNTHLVGLQQTQDKTHLFSLSSNKYVINWNLLSGALEKSVSTNEKKDGVLYKIAADGKKIIFTNGYEKITELNLKDTTKRIEYTN